MITFFTSLHHDDYIGNQLWTVKNKADQNPPIGVHEYDLLNLAIELNFCFWDFCYSD